jgi:hypothetical protein
MHAPYAHREPARPQALALPPSIDAAASEQACNTQAQLVCQECGEPFAQARSTQIFCCPAHKAAFHNRNMKRGKVVLPLLLTMTSLRRAKKGSLAAAQCSQARAWVYELAARWEREDKLAGRAPMALVTQAKMEARWSPVDLEVDD